MNFLEVIRRNLDGGAFRNILNEFTNNVIRSTERTVEPAITEKEPTESDACVKAGTTRRSNRQLIFDDIHKVQGTSEPVPLEEMILFFTNLQQNMPQSIHTVESRPEKDDSLDLIPNAQTGYQSQPRYVSSTSEQLHLVDPIYYVSATQNKLLNFEFELSCSRRDYEDRLQQLNSNLLTVERLSMDIVSRNGQLLVSSLAGIVDIDEITDNQLSRIKILRQRGMISWKASYKKAEDIKILAQVRQRLECKLNFLKGFRRNTASIIREMNFDKSCWENIAKLVEAATSNMHKLSNHQESVTSRIHCLNNIKQRCQEKLTAAEKWSTTEFLRYLSTADKDVSPVSFTAVWIYLRPYNPQICAKAVATASRCLQQELAQKFSLQKPTEDNRIVRGALEPMVKVLSRLLAIQNHYKHPNVSQADLSRIPLATYKQECIGLNQRCFQSGLQRLIQEMLTLLQKVLQGNVHAKEYLNLHVVPLLSRFSVDSETATLIANFQTFLSS